MILVCAATGTEAAACRAGIAAAGLAGLEVLETGVGPARAAASLARRLSAAARPRLVVSAGFAGALDGAIAPLAWITATAVYRLSSGRVVPVTLAPGLLRVAPGAARCAVVGAPEVVGAPVAGLPLPAAADMESAALAELCDAAALPFAVLRLVTDSPARPLGPVARHAAAALGGHGAASRAAHGARALFAAARAPGAALDLVRDGLRWRAALREGWRARAREIAGLA